MAALLCWHAKHHGYPRFLRPMSFHRRDSVMCTIFISTECTIGMVEGDLK